MLNVKLTLRINNMEKVIEKKYILTDETVETFGHVLHRIKAIKAFGYLNKVEKGQLGGWVEKEDNRERD